MENKNASGRRLVIAVDGPAASGKGTLAKRLATHYGLPHLDTGLLYRAVAKKVLDGGAEDETARAIHEAQQLQLADLDDPTLPSEEIGQKAAVVSAIPEVRAALLDYQRRFAAQEGGAVLDGRDIGTVICPDATVKLYIEASVEVRAQRRFLQQQQIKSDAQYDSILAALAARDAMDKSRAVAPLKPADDAVTLDTSAMTADAVFQAALALVSTRIL